MSIRTLAMNAAILGLRGGGQISPAMAGQHLDNAMRKLYIDTGMLRVPVYIDQVADQALYTIPDPSFAGLAGERRLVMLNRVLYSDPVDPLIPLPTEITSSTTLSRWEYGFKQIELSGSLAWRLELYTAPGDSVTKGLELVQAFSSDLDDYVPAYVQSDAREALEALLKHYLLSEKGKPWSDATEAKVEMGKYLTYSASIRILVERDFTQRDLTAVSAIPFII